MSIIELYLPTKHTFILARSKTMIFDSTKIIMKLARPEPEHSLLVLWLVLLCVSERGRTQSLINVTHIWRENKNVIWSINCKGKESFRYELMQWNCKNIAITWCIYSYCTWARKRMSRNISCTPRLNQFVSGRDVSPGVSKLLCIKTTGKQTHIQNGSW